MNRRLIMPLPPDPIAVSGPICSDKNFRSFLESGTSGIPSVEPATDEPILEHMAQVSNSPAVEGFNAIKRMKRAVFGPTSFKPGPS